MFRYAVPGILLGVVPWILGMPWARILKVRNLTALALSAGYFMELAVFHWIAFFSALTFTSFRTVVTVYSVCLVLACVLSVLYLFRHPGPFLTSVKGKPMKGSEWVFLAAFLVLTGLQIVRTFTRDITYMSYDDAIYTAFGMDALNADRIGVTDAYTGVASTLNIQRSIQTSLVFPSYLSAVSGISVAGLEHTVQAAHMVLLSYATYVYAAGELFERRESRLVFLVLIALFYIYGYHSHYSLTFRLLGPNYQGKAVLAVSLTPLVLTMLSRKLREPFAWKTGLFFLLLSTGAVSLTLWGTGTMLVLMIFPVALSLAGRERDWKKLLYIPFGCTVPLLFMAMFLVYRFAV